MPKIVDHEARRLAVGEAVWRVVRRDGLDAASVRAVAAESGMSASAMRHYFDGHTDLQRSAMEALIARVAARVRLTAEAEASPRQRAIDVLLELLPADDERQAEAEVWFAFVAKARTEPAFAALADTSYEAIRSLVGQVVGWLQPGAPGPDAGLEVERLFALVDGLVLHAVQQPGRISPSTMRAVLTAHVRQLAG